MKTAISEAVTNAIIHGYEQKPGVVEMELVLYPDSIEVTIEDQGVGIEDIEKATIPTYTSTVERIEMGSQLCRPSWTAGCSIRHGHEQNYDEKVFHKNK